MIVVSKILGHAKQSTTFDTNSCMINEMQEEAAQIMDGWVSPIQVELPE